MERIALNLPEREYGITIGTGLIAEIARAVDGLAGCRKVALVSHPSLARLHHSCWEELAEKLGKSGHSLYPVLFRAGERYKNLNTVKRIYQDLLALGMERSDVVIAWGGGVAGDLAGFTAASYMRGIRYIQVPTTLMAMVDSSIGGKVGVDLPEGKNLVGFFQQPAAVYCDIALLKTLPKREYVSGLAEVAKYALVFDPDLYKRLLEDSSGLLERRMPELVPVIAVCAAIKARLTEEDERDLKGRRILLNYGHTFAHSLEAVTSYRSFLHGEAVALGMRMAARLAENLGLAEKGLYADHLALLEGLGLVGLLRKEGLEDGLVDKMKRSMAFDKKREAGSLRLVLLEKVGRPLVLEREPDREVADSILSVLKEEAGMGEGRGGKR
jgi:3-dehydroquinate synthase